MPDDTAATKLSQALTLKTRGSMITWGADQVNNMVLLVSCLIVLKALSQTHDILSAQLSKLFSFLVELPTNQDRQCSIK